MTMWQLLKPRAGNLRLWQAGLLEGAAPVAPITTAEYHTPAQRPCYSLLDCTASRQALNLEPLHWRAALAQVIARVGAA